MTEEIILVALVGLAVVAFVVLLPRAIVSHYKGDAQVIAAPF